MTHHGLDDPPDVALCKRAAAKLGLHDPKAWREKSTGRWLVSGFIGRELRLYCPVGKEWEELTVGGKDEL